MLGGVKTNLALLTVLDLYKWFFSDVFKKKIAIFQKWAQGEGREAVWKFIRLVAWPVPTSKEQINTIWIYFPLFREEYLAHSKSQVKHPCELFWCALTSCQKESFLGSVGISFFLYGALLWYVASNYLKGSVWSMRGTSLLCLDEHLWCASSSKQHGTS